MWQPGQSGNPGGKPRGSGLAQKIRRTTSDGVVILEALMEILEKDKPNSADVIAACRLLLAYGWGRPIEREGAGGSGPAPEDMPLPPPDFGSVQKVG